jgi:hypothetical protein
MIKLRFSSSFFLFLILFVDVLEFLLDLIVTFILESTLHFVKLSFKKDNTALKVVYFFLKSLYNLFFVLRLLSQLFYLLSKVGIGYLDHFYDFLALYFILQVLGFYFSLTEVSCLVLK